MLSLYTLLSPPIPLFCGFFILSTPTLHSYLPSTPLQPFYGISYSRLLPSTPLRLFYGLLYSPLLPSTLTLHSTPTILWFIILSTPTLHSYPQLLPSTPILPFYALLYCSSNVRSLKEDIDLMLYNIMLY